MEIKEYKRIPILKETKKRLAKDKEDSDYPTYDDFVNYLLDMYEARNQPSSKHTCVFHDKIIYIWELEDGKTVISLDLSTWTDISKIVKNLER